MLHLCVVGWHLMLLLMVVLLLLGVFVVLLLLGVFMVLLVLLVLRLLLLVMGVVFRPLSVLANHILITRFLLALNLGESLQETHHLIYPSMTLHTPVVVMFVVVLVVALVMISFSFLSQVSCLAQLCFQLLVRLALILIHQSRCCHRTVVIDEAVAGFAGVLHHAALKENIVVCLRIVMSGLMVVVRVM